MEALCETLMARSPTMMATAKCRWADGKRSGAWEASLSWPH